MKIIVHCTHGKTVTVETQYTNSMTALAMELDDPEVTFFILNRPDGEEVIINKEQIIYITRAPE